MAGFDLNGFNFKGCFEWYKSILSSISSLKCLINPYIGHAAASPKAQIVCPSIYLLNSSIISISA